MSPDVIELKRPQKLAEFLDSMSEEDLLAALDGPVVDETETITGIQISAEDLETNSRLTIIKMFETVPEMHKPFSFRVRKFTGAAYVQAMRTTLAKGRKLAKEKNYDLGQPFRMIQIGIETQATCDVVTVMRVPKGQKHSPAMEELMQMLGGSHVGDDED